MSRYPGDVGVVAALGFTEGAWKEIEQAPCKIYLETPSSIAASLKRVARERENELMIVEEAKRQEVLW